MPSLTGKLVTAIAALAALGAVIVYFSAGADGTWTGFPLDDAWIHRVYARAFAGGHGFQYNVGANEAGATSPLWVVVSAPAEWLAGISTDAVALGVKAISVLLAAAFVVGVVAVSREAFGEHPAFAVIPAAIVAADPRLVFSLLSGMESVLVAALWIWAVVATLRRRWIALACLAALLPLSRPEAALILPAIWIPIAMARGVGVTRKAISIAITLLPAALWAWFCWSTTGHPLPNTFYVKAGAVSDVVEIARNTALAISLTGYASTAAFPLGLLGFAAWCWKRRGRGVLPALLLLVVPLAYAAAISASRTVRLDGYYWTRWYDPPAFLLGAASAFGLVWAARALFESARRRSSGRAIAVLSIAGLVLFAAGAALSSVQLARSARAAKRLLASDIAVIERTNVAAGEWISRHASKGEVVGAHDAGAVKYFGGRPTIDFGGLNYHPLAFDWSLAEGALRRSTWLVVFPRRLEGTGALRRFEERMVFSVPPGEYTICDCPGQTVLAIYGRKGARSR